MKKFFAEFKKFITRGNVVDMAVGVIVGSSFTAIVNGLSNFVLKPMINWLLATIFGADSLKDLYTMLKTATKIDETGAEVVDLENSIYIDWGSFINAIINFFLIALVLFCIVKSINKLRDNHREFGDTIRKKNFTKAQRKELKANGISNKDKAAADAYFAQKAAVEKKAAEEKAAAEKAANPSTEDLLKEIRDLLKNK